MTKEGSSFMTTTLETAFDELAKLPPEDQDTFAAWIMAELGAEQRWRKLLASSPDLLAALAAEALNEHRAGKSQPLDPEQL